MSTLSATMIAPKIKPKIDLKEPGLFKIIYINDNSTTMDFVITSLSSIFNIDTDQAIEIAERIHHEGSAVVAILPYEIAEQKGIEVTVLARSHGFPLQVKLEAAE